MVDLIRRRGPARLWEVPDYDHRKTDYFANVGYMKESHVIKTFPKETPTYYKNGGRLLDFAFNKDTK